MAQLSKPSPQRAFFEDLVMPTRPQTQLNKSLSLTEERELKDFLERGKARESKPRDAQLNAKVNAENAAKKAAADVKSFTAKPKAGGAPLGRFGGQQGAMQNMAAKKAANDRSDVQMSKRVQSPTSMKAATPNITPRQSPNPSQNTMTSSPRPPKRPGFKAGGSVKPCKTF
jgi:hypothetical protein